MSERDYLTDAQNENASLRAWIVELEEGVDSNQHAFLTSKE